METTHVRTAGGIVIGESGTVALVRSRNSNAWLFPKGHIEEGEDDETAARREIREETGLTDLEYIDDLGSFTRTHRHADREEEKEVHMFLFAAPTRATITAAHEIEDARWFPLKEVAHVLGDSPDPTWFARDRAWFATVFERVRLAIQRD